MKTYQPGDKAYIIVNNREYCEVTIVKQNANLYVIKFASGGGIQVRGTRLYATQREAMNALPAKEEKPKHWHSHYEYGL